MKRLSIDELLKSNLTALLDNDKDISKDILYYLRQLKKAQKSIKNLNKQTIVTNNLIRILNAECDLYKTRFLQECDKNKASQPKSVGTSIFNEVE